MKKHLSTVVLLVALAAACFWLWTIIFPSPEKIIRKRLAQVAAEASFPPGENPLVIAARSENLAARFGTNVEINLDLPEHGEHSIAGRAEITQAAAGARRAVSSLKVEFPDVSVTLNPDQQSATADVNVEVQAGGEKENHLQVVRFTFQKVEKDWLIIKVETVRKIS